MKSDLYECIRASSRTLTAKRQQRERERAMQDEQQQQPPPQEAQPEAAAAASRSATLDTSEDVEVHLKFIHHERIVTVRVPMSVVVAELKTRALEVYRSVEEQSTDASSRNGASLRLIYKGKVLKDDQTLGSYHFVDGDTLHAVFSRPHATSSTDANVTTAASTANSPATANATSGGMHDMGNGVMIGRFNIETDADTPLPSLGRLVNSMLASLGGGGSSSEPAEGVTSTRISSSDGSGLQQVAAAMAPAGTQSPAPAHSEPAPSRVPSAQAPVFGPPVPPAPAPTPTPTATPTPEQQGTNASANRSETPAEASRRLNAILLLNEAATLRRSMPAIELTPLSSAPELSPEMYILGNAVQQAADTFMALHRQMSYVAQRFLHENHLTDTERARLRGRITELLPVLYHTSTMSRSLAVNLADTQFGPGRPSATAERSEAPSPPTAPARTATPAPTAPTTSPASAPVAPSFDDFRNFVRARREHEAGAENGSDEHTLVTATAPVIDLTRPSERRAHDNVQREDSSTASTQSGHDQAASQTATSAPGAVGFGDPSMIINSVDAFANTFRTQVLERPPPTTENTAEPAASTSFADLLRGLVSITSALANPPDTASSNSSSQAPQPTPSTSPQTATSSSPATDTTPATEQERSHPHDST